MEKFLFKNSGQFIDKLNNWFHLFIAIPLAAVAYTYLEINSGSYTALFEDAPLILFIITLIFCISLGVWSFRGYKKSLLQLKNDKGLFLVSEKVSEYFQVAFIFYVKFFIAMIFATLGLLISGDIKYAGLFIVIIFILSVNRPSLLDVANKLGLKKGRKTAFIDKEDFNSFPEV